MENKEYFIERVVEERVESCNVTDELGYILTLLPKKDFEKYMIGPQNEQSISKYVSECIDNGTITEALSYALSQLTDETLIAEYGE